MEGLSQSELRREMRRKKILENSESRMNKLHGRMEADFSQAPKAAAVLQRPLLGTSNTDDFCPDPPDIPISEVIGSNGAMVDDDGLPSLYAQLSSGNGRMGGTNDGLFGSPVVAVPVWWQRWDRWRSAAVALLALLMRLLLLSDGYTRMCGQNVLVPFVMIELASYLVQLYSIPLTPSSGLLGTALLLCGVQSSWLEVWRRYLGFIATAWADLMVYVFALVLSFKWINPGIDPVDWPSSHPSAPLRYEL